MQLVAIAEAGKGKGRIGSCDLQVLRNLYGSDGEDSGTDEEAEAVETLKRTQQAQRAAVAERPVSFVWPTAKVIADMPMPQRACKANMSFYEPRGVPFEASRVWPKGALAAYEPHGDRRFPPHSKVWAALPRPARAAAGAAAGAAAAAPGSERDDFVVLEHVRDHCYIGSANATKSAWGTACDEEHELAVSNWEAGVLFAPVVRLQLPANVAPYVLDASPAGAVAAQALQEHLGLRGLVALRELVVGGGFTRLHAAPPQFELAFRMPPPLYAEGDTPHRMSDAEKAKQAHAHQEVFEDEDESQGSSSLDREGADGIAMDDEMLLELAKAASACGADPVEVVARARAGESFEALFDWLLPGGAGGGKRRHH